MEEDHKDSANKQASALLKKMKPAILKALYTSEARNWLGKKLSHGNKEFKESLNEDKETVKVHCMLSLQKL